MKFHPDKCKVLTIKHKHSPLVMLPFVAYHYHPGETLLSYADSEKDLGVYINKSFTFNEQCEILLTQANQKFGILKRTCHFVTCKNRRRVLYLALVRSQFEHCLLKQILSEEAKSYSHEVYISKCKQVNMPPLSFRFNFNDINIFHKIVYKTIPINISIELRLH